MQYFNPRTKQVSVDLPDKAGAILLRAGWRPLELPKPIEPQAPETEKFSLTGDFLPQPLGGVAPHQDVSAREEAVDNAPRPRPKPVRR